MILNNKYISNQNSKSILPSLDYSAEPASAALTPALSPRKDQYEHQEIGNPALFPFTKKRQPLALKPEVVNIIQS
jgi:hypothetical protein